MTVDLTKLFSVGQEVILLQEYIDTLEESRRKILMVRNRFGTIYKLFSNYMVLEFGSITITAELKDVFLGDISHLRNHPHILYRLLDCQEEQNNPRDLLVFIEENSADANNGGFDWTKTSEGINIWSDIMDSDINLDTIKYDVLTHNLYIEDSPKDNNPSIITNIPNNSFKPNQHEIRLQKPHSVIIRGTVPKGNRVCTRKHQVAVCSRHLSYSACSFRS